jgi:hypothetical protein
LTATARRAAGRSWQARHLNTGARARFSFLACIGRAGGPPPDVRGQSPELGLGLSRAMCQDAGMAAALSMRALDNLDVRNDGG